MLSKKINFQGRVEIKSKKDVQTIPQLSVIGEKGATSGSKVMRKCKVDLAVVIVKL